MVHKAYRVEHYLWDEGNVYVAHCTCGTWRAEETETAAIQRIEDHAEAMKRIQKIYSRD